MQADTDFFQDVLDYGFVRLDACMADDLSVVNSARVSMQKRAEELDEAGIGLIGFLMRGRHGTPFEHNAFRYHVKCPIFVAREWMRHRIGSFNEQSGRYSKFEPEFYIPDPDVVRTQVGKPGAYTFNVMTSASASITRSRLVSSYQVAWDNYEAMLESDVAKEVARLVLPVATYTQFYWTINARSLMNFLSLRVASDAQWEIRQFAEAVEDIFAAKMPITYQTFLANGRVAP